MERTSIDFHHQSPGADVVGLISANSVCQAPLRVTITGNSCVDGGGSTSNVDLDGRYGPPAGLLHPTLPTTAQSNVPTFCRSDNSVNFDRTLNSVPIEVQCPASALLVDCIGRAVRTDNALHQPAATECGQLFCRAIQRDASLCQPASSNHHPDYLSLIHI